MATLTDRPHQKVPAQPNPAETLLPRPLSRRSPEPNGRRKRLLAYLFLFGPGAALILGVLAAVAAVIAIALGTPGVKPPATGAAELVPASALLYVHLSTDPSRPAVRRALAISRRLPGSPLLFTAVTNRLDAILGGAVNGVSFSADVRPWLGKEAALAVLDSTGASAGSLIVLDVRARFAARRFLNQVGAQSDGSYLGVPLLIGRSGTVLSFIRHYLVVGQAASVREAVDVAAGKATSLASSVGYDRVAASEPASRVLDAYGSADGIRRGLVPSSGLLGELGALLQEPSLSGATLSLSAAGRELQIDVHRTLVPNQATRISQFTPTLADVLPGRSQLLLDAAGLRSNASGLLALAARLGIADKLGPVLSRLGRALAAQGVNPAQFLSLFAGETAIALGPAVAGSGPVPLVLTRTQHPARARAILASLQGPLTQVFAPPSDQPGVVPEVTDLSVDGVPVYELSLAPGFHLDYAVARGLVVLSTGRAGIAGVLTHARTLADAPSFQSMLGDGPAEATSLVFFDPSQLLRLGLRSGLIDSTRNATLWLAAEKIRAVSLESWRGANDTTTQLRLQIP